MKKLPLHTRILIGIGAGLVWGFLSGALGVDPLFTIHYLKPLGTIFMNLLLMIAIPLVFVSLVLGVANLGDVAKFSRLGGKTIFIYLITTCLAITLGLVLVNIIRPGKQVSTETRERFAGKYQEAVTEKVQSAEKETEKQPLQPLVDIVPRNIITAAGDNQQMLQIVFVAILIGIALLKIPKEKAEPVLKILDGLNDVILRIIDFIMLFAPIGVFGLMAAFVVETEDPDLLLAVGVYSLTILAGLMGMVFVVYPLLLIFFSKIKPGRFFKGIQPAMLLAFSTSSSSATLPVTMKRCEEKLGISEEASGFVLPLGATINMDGTSLYQAIAAVFIAQVYNMGLSIGDQLTILITALLASIGSAGVPGAGMIMLVIVLKSVGIPEEGIMLILAPDRLLDMLRTVTNVTGDATVASVVASSEGLVGNDKLRTTSDERQTTNDEL